MSRYNYSGASKQEQHAALDNGLQVSPRARGGTQMPQKALSMRKIREVLRLRYDLGLRQQEIARSCCICQSSMHRYSRFCELYRRWRRKQDIVLRQEHPAGAKMFVDWAGDTIPIYDRNGGEARPASLFVATLGASSYTFARATASLDLPNWIECHIHCLEPCRGAPA
jgi:transposase